MMFLQKTLKTVDLRDIEVGSLSFGTSTLETLATLARVQSQNGVFTKNTKTVDLQDIEVGSLSFETPTLGTLATLAQGKDKKSSSKKHRMVFNTLKNMLYFFIWYHTNSSIAFYEGQPL